MSRMVTFYRRHLQHWHPPNQDLFVTWRLKGSLPSHLRGIPSKETPGQRFLELDRALDRADAGPLWLKDPDIAETIIAVLRTLREQRIATVHAYAVLANHVHVLLTPTAPIARLTRMVKGATARKANLLLNLTGSPSGKTNHSITGCATPPNGGKSEPTSNAIPSPQA